MSTTSSTTWDDRGVPTIEAESELEVCHGYGHAQAVAHATAVLELYGVARGRAAALWGGAFTAGDVEHARLGLDGHVAEWVSAQEETTLARLQAFCDGFNAACADDPALGGGRREVLPVTPADVVAHALKVFLVFARFFDEGLAFEPTPGGLLGGGSNAWAVGGHRSATGEALLLTNPHIPWLGAFRLFEARTLSPGRRCHGVTPIGFPWQSFAYTPDVGWTHTVNPIPQLWVYRLELAGDRYRHDGALLALEQREHVVQVRDGAPVPVRERRSVHGPVLTAPDGAEVAIRVAGVLHAPASGCLEGWWQMSLATDVEGLLRAQDRWPLPMFNVLAADAGGSVAAAFCGVTPHRPGGTFEDSRERRPGEDPGELWRDVNPPHRLPRVVDPEGGWVQNVNEAPWWFCDPPLDPAEHPDGIAPPPHLVRDLRSPVSRAWLTGTQLTGTQPAGTQPSAPIGAERLLELKWRTRVTLADVVLADLLAAAADEPDLAGAVTTLRSWDRHADPGSRGYPLFHLWMHAHLPVGALVMDATHLVPATEPGGIPTGLTDPAAAVQALRAAVQRLGSLGHPADVSYARFAEIAADGVDVPAVGAPSFTGAFRCLELAPADGRWQGMGGDTWISLVRFTADGPEASALLVNGNTTEPGAPGHRAQVPWFAEGRLLPLAPLGRPRTPSEQQAVAR